MNDQSPWRDTRPRAIADLAFGASEVAPLGSVSIIAGGVTLGRSFSGPDSIELPYLRVANVQDGFIDTAEMKTVRILRTEIERYRLRPGDVLMTEGGDFDKLGRGAVWNGSIDPCLHQNHIFRVRCDPSVLLPEYLAMYSASPSGRRLFLSLSKQTTNLASINLSQLKAFPVPIPSLQEQHRITEVLDSADEAIHSTERLIAKLGQAKQGLLHDILTRGINESGQLRGPLTDSEGFMNSPLGRVPMEWSVGPLGKFITLQRGFDITVAEQRPGDIPVVSSSGISSFHDRAMVKGPGVVIGRKGKLGDSYYITSDFWPHDTSLWVKQFQGIVPKFAALLLKSMHLERFDAATSVPTLNRNFVHPILIAVPPISEQNRILSTVDTASRRIQREGVTLAKLRLLKKGLMDDLLTGRVRVRAPA